MNHPENRAEIQDGGNQRRFGDLYEGNVDGFSHDESDGPHHRRHQLAAHAGGGFHPTGKRSSVAKAFHEWDGELPRGNDVGNPGAGDSTHQRR
ncbi:hypothetical protein D3C75_1185890 [compost metagenome]